MYCLFEFLTEGTYQKKKKLSLAEGTAYGYLEHVSFLSSFVFFSPCGAVPVAT
jgi:hypothetical protein